MLKFILYTIFQQNKMNESTLDLFCNHQEQKDADEFATELERKASELEVTVDYYMMEFM